MAVCCCENHAPRGTKRHYIRSVQPFGYLETAMVCGSVNCESPALIWLEQEESDAYDNGRRIFNAVVASMKMRAES